METDALLVLVVTLRPLWWVFRAAVVTTLVVDLAIPGWAPVNGLVWVSASIVVWAVMGMSFGTVLGFSTEFWA